MKMIRRATRRNRADKLRYLRAAGFIAHPHAIPAIGSWLGRTICESNDSRLVNGAGRLCGLSEFRCAIRIRALRADDGNGVGAGVIEPKRFARSNVDSGIRADLKRTLIYEKF